MRHVEFFWVFLLTSFIALAAILSYGIWELSKKWNYSWSYKDQVKTTILENVKEECIKK